MVFSKLTRRWSRQGPGFSESSQEGFLSDLTLPRAVPPTKVQQPCSLSQGQIKYEWWLDESSSETIWEKIQAPLIVL